MQLVSRISRSREDRDVKFKGVGQKRYPACYTKLSLYGIKKHQNTPVLTIFVLFGILLTS